MPHVEVERSWSYRQEQTAPVDQVAAAHKHTPVLKQRLRDKTKKKTVHSP